MSYHDTYSLSGIAQIGVVAYTVCAIIMVGAWIFGQLSTSGLFLTAIFASIGLYYLAGAREEKATTIVKLFIYRNIKFYRF